MDTLSARIVPDKLHSHYGCPFLLYFFTLQISCVSSSTELADRVRFKSYFQLLPTEADIAPAYFGVIRQYEWRHVALIVQNENRFTVVSTLMDIYVGDLGVVLYWFILKGTLTDHCNWKCMPSLYVWK